MLAGQRRWREIGWTLGFGVAFVMLALLILGTDPFVAFVSYQLPRIVSGEAFSFNERADVPAFIVSRNLSIYGIAAKLRLLGLAGVGPTTAHALTWGSRCCSCGLPGERGLHRPTGAPGDGLARSAESCCLAEPRCSVGICDRARCCGCSRCSPPKSETGTRWR